MLGTPGRQSKEPPGPSVGPAEEQERPAVSSEVPHYSGERAALTDGRPPWGAQHSDVMPRGRKPTAQAPQVDKANRALVSQADPAVNTEINRNEPFIQ